MSHSLTLELSDSLYDEVHRQAVVAGRSPADIAAEALEQAFGSANGRPPGHGRGDVAAARARFEQHFGEVDLGCPTGVDNEEIDADLAREYAENHESG